MSRLSRLPDMPLSVGRALASAPGPGEVIKGVRELSRRLERIAEGTDSLPRVRLQASLTGLEATVQTLAAVAEPLQGTSERLGRLADRLPGRVARTGEPT